MDGRACPCGLGDGYDGCCGRLHAGEAAPTAEALMRARYSAFAVGDLGYLLGSWHRSSRAGSSERTGGGRISVRSTDAPSTDTSLIGAA